MASTAYEQLTDRLERIEAVESAAGLLSWDQQVTMPEGGTPVRSKQQSVLSSLEHELLTDEETGRLLDAASDEVTDDRQQAVIREARRSYERAAAVPREIVEDLSTASSEALGAWEEARADDDFETFEPHLERLVDLRQREAAAIDDSRDPYAVLLEEYEPCLSIDRIEAVLARLKETLVPMIDEIAASDVDLETDAFAGAFPEAKQEQQARELLSTLGYDWDRGRLDTSAHPFTSGNQFDCRVTVRYDESDPLELWLATIHEFGHAFYNLGLPQDEWGTPLGTSRDLSVHESQSRLWENHVGRTEAFFEQTLPSFNDRFDTSVTPRAAYETANQVYDDNLIRIEADELTYHLHIVIRYEIESALIRGELDVSEVPAVWNDKYEEYLGIRPETDANGCLQDIHWSYGNFGYFPTYSLGSVMATQLFDAAERELGDLTDDIRAGEFDRLAGWLRENVHGHGARYETNELVRQATGEDYSADAFVSYVREKYGALYDLEG